MNWDPLEPRKAELLRTFFRVSNLLNKHYLIFTRLPHVTKHLRMVVYTWWVGQLPYKCPLRRCAFDSQMGRLGSIKPHQKVDLMNSQTNSSNRLTTRWLLYTILANGELPDTGLPCREVGKTVLYLHGMESWEWVTREWSHTWGRYTFWAP